MKLNCDLGEGLDHVDAQVMPFLQMANIACGGHAGDDTSIHRCLLLARTHQVLVGAHPGYPDRANLGRVSLALSRAQLEDTFLAQVNRFLAACSSLGMTMGFIKPHGALYNDMIQNPKLFSHIAALCSRHFPDTPLVVQALPNNQAYQQLTNENYPALWYEGFADRAYTDQGLLVSRKEPHALYREIPQILAQAEELAGKNGVTTESGAWLDLKIDTLCIHGDTPNAVPALMAIQRAGIVNR